MAIVHISPSGQRVYITKGPEWERTITALREIDASLPGQLRKEIRQAVKPLVAEAKQRVRMMPVKGHGHTGLRRRVARGVRSRASLRGDLGVRIVTTMANPDEAALPRGLDRTAGWRHPVFGRGPWVWQHHAPGHWFMDTFQHSRDDIERDLHRVLERAANTVARAGGDTLGS